MLSDYQEIGFQELAPEIQQEFRGWQEKLRFDGPLVGALVSPGKDQIALAIHQGEVWVLLRVPLAASSVDIALRYFNGLGRLSTHPVSTRVSGTSLLYARPLMRGFAAAFEALTAARSVSPDENKRILMLVSEIRALHDAQLFHGSLTLESVLWHNNRVVLLDCGLQFFNSSEARKLTSLSTTVEVGQSRDRQSLVKLLEPYVPRADRLSLLSLPDDKIAFFNSLVRIIQPSHDRTGQKEDLEASQSESPVSRVMVRARPVSTGKNPSVVKSSLPKREGARSSATNKKQSSWILFGVLSLGVFFLLYFAFAFDLTPPLSWSRFSTESMGLLQDDWSSGDRVRMARVAQAAVVSGDSNAQKVILGDLQNSDRDEKLLLWNVLRVVTGLRWYEDLAKHDRAALFAFALAPLLREKIQEIPDLSQVDGRVILALFGGMPAEKGSDGLFQLLSQQIEKLPPEFSSLLDGQGTQNLGNPAQVLRSYILIRAGIDLSSNLQLFLPPTLLLPEVQYRLKLLDLNRETPNAAALLQHVQRLPALSDTLLWFTRNPLVDWSRLSPEGVLALLSGARLPQKGLELSLLADLLRAPFLSPENLASVVGELEKRLMRPNVAPFLVAIAQDKSLTREQAVSLVAALNVRGDSTHVFIDRWFEMQPSPESVVYLLLAAAESFEPNLKQYAVEAFHLSAARYLRGKKDWTVSPDQLAALASHPEALARGLAYSQASVDKSTERSVLEERLKKENVSSLKKLLTEKLSRITPSK